MLILLFKATEFKGWWSVCPSTESILTYPWYCVCLSAPPFPSHNSYTPPNAHAQKCPTPGPLSLTLDCSSSLSTPWPVVVSPSSQPAEFLHNMVCFTPRRSPEWSPGAPSCDLRCNLPCQWHCCTLCSAELNLDFCKVGSLFMWCPSEPTNIPLLQEGFLNACSVFDVLCHFHIVFVRF